MSQLTLTERLKAARDILFAFDVPPPAVAAEVAPAAYEGSLITGEIVRATPSLAEGSVFSVVSESGDIPAPDGTHQLADGATVEVAGGEGKITSVTLPTPVAAQVAPTPPVAMSEEVKAELDALKISNTELKSEINKNKTEFEAKFSKMEELVKLSVEGFIALAEVPAVEPTKKPTTDKVELSGEERAEDYFKRIKNLKNKK